jgi:dGTPase
MDLKPYAADPNHSLGRVHAEKKSLLRNDFQRDRDRIIHSAAFRRLEYKTQVFVNHEGDMFRTRLTHSIEVSQISRGIARTLSCHEDLSEAIALAHDLGHTPFGHAGQDALNDCMKHFGGFEHNLQSLRVVDFLEKRYADFDGLNLTFEAREGILKHCSVKNAKLLGSVGDRFITKEQPSLEAQIVNFADEIAYNNHDIDDGFRSGLISFKSLMEVPIFSEFAGLVKQQHSLVSEERKLHETIRRIIHALINDLCLFSKKALTKYNPCSVQDVRHLSRIIGLSPSMEKKQLQLKKFLMISLYRHPRVAEMSQNAIKVIHDLFDYLMNDPKLMNVDHAFDSEELLARFVADYIAGMTDRFALQSHKNLTE